MCSHPGCTFKLGVGGVAPPCHLTGFVGSVIALWLCSVLEHNTTNVSAPRTQTKIRRIEPSKNSTSGIRFTGSSVRNQWQFKTPINLREKTFFFFQNNQRLKVETPPSVLSTGSHAEKMSVSVLTHLHYFVTALLKWRRYLPRLQVISVIVERSLILHLICIGLFYLFIIFYQRKTQNKKLGVATC